MKKYLLYFSFLLLPFFGLSQIFHEGFNNIESLPSSGWIMTNQSEPLGQTNWFQGNPERFSAHEGPDNSFIAANHNNAGGTQENPGTISNWLITPTIEVKDGDVFSFWTKTPPGSVWNDRLEIRWSEGNIVLPDGVNDIGSFTNLFQIINDNYTLNYPTEWEKYEYIVNGVGNTPQPVNFAFRYNVENSGPNGVEGNYIGIDSVSVRDANDPDPDPQDYCIPNGSGNQNVGITKVKLNTINNSSGTENDYSDYTSISTQLMAGKTYDLTVNVKTQSIIFTRAWIDWNDDKIFDTNEQFNLGTTNQDGPVTQNPYSLTIPADAVPGIYRLRIRSSTFQYRGPCGNGGANEVEDYTIVVVPNTDCDGTPEAGIAYVNPTEGLPESNYTVTAEGYSDATALKFQWQSKTNDGEWQLRGLSSNNYVDFPATAPEIPGTIVKWRLSVRCTVSNITSHSDVATFTVLAPSCVEPENLDVNEITETSALLNWTGDGDDYDIEYGLSGFVQGNGTLIENIDSSYTINNLDPDSTYEFYVRQNCEFNQSEWVGPVSFTTLAVCEAPSDLTVSEIAETSAELSWTGSGSTYDIEYGLSGFTQGDGTTIENQTNPYILMDLTPDTTYDFYVRQDCGVNQSEWVGPVSFTTLAVCEAPSDLITSEITETSVELGWAGSGSTYDIEYGLSGFTQGDGTTIENQASPYTLMDLTPDTNYDFYVRQDCGLNQSEWVGPVSFTTNPAECIAPSNIEITDITEFTAELSWTGSGTSYDIEYGESGFAIGEGIFIFDISSPHVLTNLEPYTQYDFYIRQDCGVNESEWVGPLSFTTEPTECVPPGDLSISNLSDTTVTVIWSGSGMDYELEFGLSGFVIGEGTLISNVESPFTIENLEPNTSYEFYVRQDCEVNMSEWVGPKSFTTLLPACEPPENITVSDISDSSVEITWDGTGEFYDIEYGVPGFAIGDGIRVENVNSPYTLDDLSSNTSYEIYIRQDCDFNESEWVGPVGFTTDFSECSAPGNLTITGVSQTSSTLSWTGNGTDYEIEYGLSGFDIGEGTLIENAENPYLLEDLIPNTTYDFYVRQDCGDNKSDWTGPKSFTTLPPDCVAPESLTVSDITETSAVLNWIGDGDSYEIEFGEAGFLIGEGTISSNVSSPYTLENLNPNTSYDFYVRQDCEINQSEWIGPMNFMTLMPECTAPEDVAVSDITETTAVLSWTGDGDSYEIELGEIGFLIGEGMMLSNVSSPFTLENLNPNTSYDFYVRQDCEINQSEWVGPVNFMTLVPECTAPEDLAVSDITETTAVLSWIGDGDSYEIEYGETDFTIGNGILLTEVSSPYVLEDLDFNTSYDFYIRQNCEINQSEWVGPISFITLMPECNKPTDLAISNITETSAILSWLGEGDSFDVEFGIAGFLPGEGELIEGVSSPYTLEDLDPNTHYDFYVRQDCGINYSDWAGPASFITDPLACQAPSGLTADDMTQTSALLSWSGNGDSYDIEFGLTGFDQGTGEMILDITSPYLLEDLEMNTTYDFYVRQDCGINQSEWKGPVSFTTLPLDCDVPEDITITEFSETTVTLNWSGTGDSFDVEYGISGFTIGNGILIEGVISPLTIENLNSNTTYDFYVRQDCGVNQSEWAGPVSETTLPPECIAPQDLNTSDITETSATLNWIGSGEFYDIEYGLSGFTQGEGTMIENVSTPYTLTELLPNTTYDFYVRQDCGINESIWIGPVTFTTLIPECIAPNDLNVTNITDTSAVLNWDGSGTNYEIEYGLVGFTQGSGTLIQNETSPYTLGDLESNTTYEFYVRQICNLNESTWIGPVDFTTLPPPCDIPEDLTVSEITDTSVILTWLGDGNNYDIEYGLSGFLPGSGNVIENVNNPYTLENLSPNTTYDFYVRQDCGINQSDWSGPVNFTTLPLPCNPPGNLTVSNITESSAVLNWSGSGTYYDIEYGLTGFSQGSGILIEDVTAPFTLNDLDSYTTYDFYVRRDCGLNESEWAGPKTFTTLPPECIVPDDLSVDDITHNSAVLSWSGDGLSYDIEYGLSGFLQGTGTLIENVGSPYTINDLSPDTTYNFYVRQDCGVNESEWIGPVGFTTEPPPCIAPINISISNITPSSVILYWLGNGVSDIEYGFAGFEQGTGTFLNGVTSPYFLNNLEPNETYEFYIRQNCIVNYSEWLGPFSFETNPLACQAPSGLSVNNITDTSAVLSWVGSGSEYEIEYGLSGFAQGTGDVITSASSPYTLENLDSYTTYDFYVRKDCGVNQSSWKGPVTFTTEPPECPVPENLEISDITQNSAVASWTGEGDSYDIEYGFIGFVPGTGTLVENVSSPYTIENLQSGSFYVFYVRLNCEFNQSTWVQSEVFSTEIADCEAPENLEATNITTNSVVLNWEGDGLFYDVEYGESGYTQGNGTIIQNVNSPYLLNNLDSATEYDFYVRKNCGVNQSIWTGPVSFTTEPEECPVPLDLAVTDISVNSAMLHWTETGDVYDIEYGLTGFIQGDGILIEGVNNPYILEGLEANTSYDFYVRQDCGINQSEWSTPETFTTLPPECTMPSDLTVTDINATSAVLEWNGDGNSYDIEYGIEGFQSGEGNLIEDVTSPYFLANLEPETTYEFYVRQHCDINQSNWAGPVSFTTEPGLNTVDNEYHVFSYFPNPVKNFLTIKSYRSIESLRIYNLTGQQIMSFDKKESQSKYFDLSTLEPGVYVLKVDLRNAKSRTFKIIKK